jgi:hypothetical protein
MQLTKATITRVDKGNQRFYQVEGDRAVDPTARLSSVTTILNVISKPALIPWARNQSLDKIRLTLKDAIDDDGSITLDQLDLEDLIETARKRPDEVRDEAAEIGSRSHLLIEEYLQGQEVLVHEDLKPMMDSFLSWERSSRIKVTFTEQMVYSGTHLFAGTMDAIGDLQGETVILDWKTSNGIYPEAALQVSAYAHAYEEMTGIHCKRAFVVRLGKTRPEFEVREVADIGQSFNAFLAAKTLLEGSRASAWVKAK